MVFSSVEFLFRFLPIFLLAYFITPTTYRNIVLLVGSLVFYAWGEPIYILLMIASILVNYLIGRKMGEIDEKIKGFGQRMIDASRQLKSRKRMWLVLALVYNFGILFAFKYLNFFVENIYGLMGKEPAFVSQLTLPLGISFYTFQIVSYVIDVYRGVYPASQNLITVATYICMFPQLVAGPIVQYSEVSKDLVKREYNLKKMEWGTCVFVLGLSYKVLLANKIASLWNSVLTIGPKGINAPIAWLGSWGFSMQIYFDFFGYSLMAIGLGYILGFTFPANFIDPYCVTSMTEFWRKWHITLGRWFREYLYIPLGGNRTATGRMLFNMFIVWALTGLWHGADWNFIIWGIGLFVILMIEKLFLKKYLDNIPVLGHVYMFILIPISWTVFNISDLHLLGDYLKRMLFLPVEGSLEIDCMPKFYNLVQTYWWLLLICIFCCTPYPMKALKKFYKNTIFKLLLLGLFWLSVYQICNGSDNPFLYFRF